MAHPSGERDLVEQTASKEPMALDRFGGRVHARWSPDEAVSPFGQLPFFIDVLKLADLFEPFFAGCPLQFSSPNAPGYIYRSAPKYDWKLITILLQ